MSTVENCARRRRPATRRRRRQTPTLAILASAGVISTAPFGCSEADTPPSPDPVIQLARQQVESSAIRAAEAEQQTQHALRLRDIDRLRYEATAVELQGQVTVLRGVLIGTAAAALACCLWLAIEIRRRRVLSAALEHVFSHQGDPSRRNSDSLLS